MLVQISLEGGFVCLFVCSLSWSFHPGHISKKSTCQNWPCPHLNLTGTQSHQTTDYMALQPLFAGPKQCEDSEKKMGVWVLYIGKDLCGKDMSRLSVAVLVDIYISYVIYSVFSIFYNKSYVLYFPLFSLLKMGYSSSLRSASIASTTSTFCLPRVAATARRSSLDASLKLWIIRGIQIVSGEWVS